MSPVLKKRFGAELKNLSGALEMVTECAKKAGLDAKRLMDVELSTEEAVANIINYAHPGSGGDFEISCRTDNLTFIIEIVDSGVPFNIFEVGNADLSSDISERPVGGLGIFLIRKLMDDVKYRRENNRNILELHVRLPKD